MLDAASTLRYPVSFTGKDRRVEINGQGWFEVAKDPKKPFYVTKGDKTVRVYGTHFNVEAYDDEKTLKVTLVEGSVKVSNGEVASMLRPGQQAVLSTSSSGVQVLKDVDIEQATAWKNGQFAFESTDLKDVMRQVERWYNIQVQYQGPVPTDQFTVGINRTATLQELLKILSISRVHFTLEGKILTVSAK
jgi:ferric-dicitrate binding protein FerR (iron transport regulator)